ncbi:effector-associated constant component EACC1 [Longispora urticae]
MSNGDNQVLSSADAAARAGAASRTLHLRFAPDPDRDDEATDRLTRGLRADLRTLDVEFVPEPLGELPEGAKGADPVTLGAVVVALSGAGGLLPACLGIVQDWLGRQSRRHRIVVTIDGDTIELDRATTDQQRTLVDAFVRRHSSG